jgi:hypothetical protein
VHPESQWPMVEVVVASAYGITGLRVIPCQNK